jgi:uncharacterized repeat protein (TIGR03843 family)
MNLSKSSISRIESSDLVITGRLVDASNATLFGHLQDDENFKIIYKPVAGERPLWDFPDGTLASREYAAYLFSERFGFNLVPATVLRDGPYGYGMVQEWIDDAQPESLIDFAQGMHQQLRKMVLFDALINNADRKYGHILLAKNELVLGCDHGVTFHKEDKLRTVLWQFTGLKLEDHERQSLEMIINHDLEFVQDLLSLEEISALKDRANSLLKNNALPEPATDRPTIPWPPV